MANFNQKNIDFARQTLVNKMGRPLSVISIYPQNSSDTKLYVQIVNNATVIAFRYVSTSTVNKSISFVGKSLTQVVQEINQLGFPLKAVQLSEIDSLSQGDFVSVGSTHVELPYGFTVHDRITSNGVLIRAKKVAVRHKNNSSIYLLPPYFEDSSLPWYPRISNGSFSQKYDGKLFHFYIKEFEDQSWSSTYGKPFKDLKGIAPTALDQNSYQLPRFPVYWNGQNITVYNGDIAISDTIIEDIDVNNGIIYTKPGFYLQEDFTVDYTYLENSYVYKDININGHFSQNPFVIDKYIVFYVIPAEGITTVNKKTVFHVIGNSIDEAINSIVVDDPSIPIAIIGAYNAQQLFASDRISMLDTRTRGGGLRHPKGPKSIAYDLETPIESLETPIEKLYPESYRFWDIGNIDGDPYPSSAAVIIDIPEDIKEILSIKEIKAKASKYLAAGVYPSFSFTERSLPSVTGMSAQVGAGYNLSFTDTCVKNTGNYAILNSMPSGHFGAGWFLDSIDIPTSIYSFAWTGYSDGPYILQQEQTRVLQINTETGVHTSYLKSTSVAGIEWKERQVIETKGSFTTYSPWVTKRLIDTEDSPTGQLIKRTLSFNSDNVIKQYKDVVIQSPFLTGNFKEQLKESITTIVDTILDLQTNGTQISERYTTVGDKEQKEAIVDYVLTPSDYNSLLTIIGTPLEDIYKDDINLIGTTIINSGCYTSGHFFKYYVQNSREFFAIPTGQLITIIEYNNQLRNLSAYLSSRINTWSGDTDAGLACATGLTKALMSGHTQYSSIDPAIPIYWVYFNATGADPGFFSGLNIRSPLVVGGTISDIATDVNYDYLYNKTLPAIFSTAIAHTGRIENADVRNTYINAYASSYASSVASIDQIINGTRTLSGAAIPTNWFLGHNRLGTFLGNAIIDLTSSYDYMSKHLKNVDYEYSTGAYYGANSIFLSSIFSGIEKVLDGGYDALYHNILRGGVVEPDTALAIYGYGWYLNNWKINYGLDTRLYQSNKTLKYQQLFDSALKQLIKNQFNSDNTFVETATINGETGPFYSSTPYKILYPLGQAVKNSTDWHGIAEGLINTIVDQHSVSGLYYTDPFKNSSSAGKQYDVLGGLVSVYAGLTHIDSYDYWEPMSTGLNNLRGCVYLSNKNSPLDFWLSYDSGRVEADIKQLKSLGINTIKVNLDYPYWFASGASFTSSLSHLVDTCVDNRLRVLPSLITDATGLVTAQSYFMTGSSSGAAYVSSVLNTVGTSPAILGWNIVDNPLPYNNNLVNYNSIGYLLDLGSNKPITCSVPYRKNSITLTGAVYPADSQNLSLPHNNQRIDYLLVNPDSNFEYYIDSLPTYTKPIIVNNYGNGKYADYQQSVNTLRDNGLPFILTNLYVLSGKDYGFLYDSNETRSLRQALSIQSLALSDGGPATGIFTQRKNFDNLYFYEDYYIPSYNSKSLLSGLSSWSYLTSLPANSGEFRFRVEQLLTVHSGLDIINHKFIDTNYYTVPEVLTTEEGNLLNFYKDEWNSHNLLSNTGLAWMLSGNVDYTKYNSFVYNWGTVLNNIANRIGLNG